MKKTYLTLIITGFILMFSANAGLAVDTINLLTLPSATYSGYYVGAIGGNLNGGYAMKYYCDDFATTTYVPSSFAVAVSTLSNLSQTKFGGAPNAVSMYQQAGWLISQMESNPSQVGQIQFALWNVFNSSAPDPAGSADWLNAARSIDASKFNFSSVRVYTATNTVNQEFISGGATALPEPSVVFLLVFGLAGLGFFRWKLRKKTARSVS
jgi:hypothetical protein